MHCGEVSSLPSKLFRSPVESQIKAKPSPPPSPPTPPPPPPSPNTPPLEGTRPEGTGVWLDLQLPWVFSTTLSWILTDIEHHCWHSIVSLMQGSKVKFLTAASAHPHPHPHWALKELVFRILFLSFSQDPRGCQELWDWILQILYWLWSVSELVPRALCWHLAKWGRSHWWVCLSTVPVDRGRHDSAHTTDREDQFRLTF